VEVPVVWGGALPSHWVNLAVEGRRIEGAVYDFEALLRRRYRFRISHGELSTMAMCIQLTVDTPNFYLMLMSYFEYIAIPANVVCFLESQSRLESDKSFSKEVFERKKDAGYEPFTLPLLCILVWPYNSPFSLSGMFS
jgi:hypothetical protein